MSVLKDQPHRVLTLLVLALVSLTGPFMYELLLGLQLSGVTAIVYYLIFDRRSCWKSRNWLDMLLVCLALGLWVALVLESRRLQNTIGGASLLFRCILAGVCLGLAVAYVLQATKRAPHAGLAHRYHYTFPIALVAALLVAGAGSRLNYYLRDPATSVESYPVIARRHVFSQARSGKYGGDPIPISYFLAYIRVGDKEAGLNVGSEEVRVGDTLTLTLRRGFFGYPVVDEIQIHHHKGP